MIHKLSRLRELLGFRDNRSSLNDERRRKALAEASAAGFPLFTTTEMSQELRQGEILSNLLAYSVRFDDAGPPEILERPTKFALIASQDCELFKDYKSRVSNGPGSSSGVLLFEADYAADAKFNLNKNAKEWGQIKNNIVERFHYLPPCPIEKDLESQGVGEILIDFSKYFTLTPTEIEYQLRSGKAHRRTRVNLLHRERLQCRIAFFLQRIALPDDYDS